MRSLMQNTELADKSWTAPTSGRVYAVDHLGLANVIHDDGAKGTLDASEAAKAGFVEYAEPKVVRMVHAEFGKRKIRTEITPGDIEIKEAGPEIWQSKTRHQYHADERGEINCLDLDVEEAKAAGFVAA